MHFFLKTAMTNSGTILYDARTGILLISLALRLPEAASHVAEGGSASLLALGRMRFRHQALGSVS